MPEKRMRGKGRESAPSLDLRIRLWQESWRRLLSVPTAQPLNDSGNATSRTDATKK